MPVRPLLLRPSFRGYGLLGLRLGRGGGMAMSSSVQRQHQRSNSVWAAVPEPRYRPTRDYAKKYLLAESALRAHAAGHRLLLAAQLPSAHIAQ